MHFRVIATCDHVPELAARGFCHPRSLSQRQRLQTLREISPSPLGFSQTVHSAHGSVVESAHRERHSKPSIKPSPGPGEGRPVTSPITGNQSTLCPGMDWACSRGCSKKAVDVGDRLNHGLSGPPEKPFLGPGFLSRRMPSLGAWLVVIEGLWGTPEGRTKAPTDL